jgi:hypothetical protein
MEKRSGNLKQPTRDGNAARRIAKSVVDLAVGNPIVENPLPLKNTGTAAPGWLGSRGEARAEKHRGASRKK